MSVTRNPNLGPSQMRARQRRLFLVRFFIVIFFLFVIIFSLAILSGNEKVKIQTIIVSGNAAVSTDDILAIANRDMGGRYWYLFSKSDSLIFPRFQIRADILKEIKTIKDVTVSWNNWQQISIAVSERKPYSVWCGNDLKAVNAECYFVDDEGFVFSKAPVFSGSIYTKDYGNLFDINPIGQYFLLKGIYSQIFNYVGILDQNNLKVLAVTFDGFDFKFVLESGSEIIFNDKNSLDSSFQNLFTAIKTNNLDLIKDADTISYIDLRYDNKIVVGKKKI